MTFKLSNWWRRYHRWMHLARIVVQSAGGYPVGVIALMIAVLAS